MRAAKVASLSSLAFSASNFLTFTTGKAASRWLAEIKFNAKTKTFKIKTAAVKGVAKHKGFQLAWGRRSAGRRRGSSVYTRLGSL